MPRKAPKDVLEAKIQKVTRRLLEHIAQRERLAIVKAPPGSGKTYLLLQGVHHARQRRRRVAVACQTNSQANDVCSRLSRDYPDVAVVRFAGGGSQEIDLGQTVTWVTDKKELPAGPCVVVGTTAKWGLVEIEDPFDVFLVDEAWQMAWKDFMLCGQVAERFVLIGDPGQIPPVVTLDVSRWETSPRAPHAAAPEIVLRGENLGAERLDLPASRRLPHDAVELIRPFYDFHFDALAEPGERAVLTDRGGREPIDKAIDLLAAGSVGGVTLPTPDGGPPLEKDEEVAHLAVRLAERLLARGASVRMGTKTFALTPAHIGLAATHRVMNSAMELSLPSKLRGHVKVDTPERWQGLERPVMIVVHPLSGVVSPSAFDLETGRLCVMASRHQGGLLIVTRDHLRNTLEEFIPSADQAVGKPDVTGRGHARHLGFWESLQSQGRVVAS
jgi:hypothetical protein